MYEFGKIATIVIQILRVLVFAISFKKHQISEMYYPMEMVGILVKGCFVKDSLIKDDFGRRPLRMDEQVLSCIAMPITVLKNQRIGKN